MLMLAYLWSMPFWGWILIFLGILIVGFIAGLIVSKKVTTKYLEKNPQMGRTPSEKQVRQVMAAVKQQQN